MNIQAAIANTAEGKKVITDLQKKYQPRQEELQRLQQEIQAIQDQLTKQSATMSEEEQARLSREAEDKQKTISGPPRMRRTISPMTATKPSTRSGKKWCV